MADMDFSQAFTYSDINKVYLMAVELSGGLVSQHGGVQLERIFQDSTLYAQVSALKTEMESILQNFTGASEYDDTATYAVGDYCTKDDYLYQCNTAVSAESWDASKWDVVTISSQYTMLKNILGVDDYSTSASYAVGDLVVYDGKMYRCITAVSSEAWDASKWSETSFVAESESILAEIQAEGATQIANVQAVYADDMAEVNAKLSRNTKAIANLIQKEGVVSISYPDSIYGRGEVPANMAKFAEVSCLRGVSRVANQLCPTATISTTKKGLTITSSNDGTISISGTTSEEGAFDILANIGSTYSGHTYLIGFGLKVTSGATPSGSTYGFKYGDSLGSGFYYGDYVATASATVLNTQDFAMNIYATNVSVNITITPIITDLTLYFGGTIPSNAQTIADIQQNYPELLIPSDYDTGSAVETVYEGVKSTGFNKYDASKASIVNSKYLAWQTGAIVSWGSGWNIDETYYPIAGGKEYELYFDAQPVGGLTEGGFVFYDADKNYISGVGFVATPTKSYVFTTPNNARFIRITIGTADNAGNICLHFNGINNGTIKPYMESTLTLPEPVTLRSAGSVADTDELCVEVDGVERRRQTKRVGSYTFTGNETPTSSYQRTNGDWYCVFQSIFNGGKDGGEGLSDKGIPFTTGNIAYDGTGTYFVTRGNGGLAFYLAGATSASAVMAWISANLPKVYYELATPIVTLTDPIIDNFLLTEAGGTITPIQTQTPEIDTSFDIEYLAL